MDEVTVAVRLNGVLAERLGARRRLVLPAGATVEDLVAALRTEAGLGDVQLAVAVGGAIVAGSRLLATGDEVAVLVPAAGG